MGETTAVPQDLSAELSGPQHAVGCRGQRDEDGIVGAGQTTLSIDLLLEDAQQLLVEAQPTPPKVGLAFIQPSRFSHQQYPIDSLLT
jgi:hypothetical protein